ATGDWHHAPDSWQAAPCRIGVGCHLLVGIELFLHALSACARVAKCSCDVGHHLLQCERIFFGCILVARCRGARSCRACAAQISLTPAFKPVISAKSAGSIQAWCMARGNRVEITADR